MKKNRKYNPVSSYRLQFNSSFTFRDAQIVIPFLHQLGIKTIYSSPVFKATKGSVHGYDVTNPLVLNPEIGSEKDFEMLLQHVHDSKMGWLQDFVPNHMAFSVENPWIYDVLEKGKDSAYYDFFDIRESHPDKNLQNRLMLPFLGKPVDTAVHDEEFSVSFSGEGFKLHYFDNEYPLSVPAYTYVFQAMTGMEAPPSVAPFLKGGDPMADFNENRQKLVADYFSFPETKEFVDACISAVNKSQRKMTGLIGHLFYYPAFWKETEKKINYRRFFTINDLICINVQRASVFAPVHRTIAAWISQKKIDGIRIDHIDGLYNPGEYLERLRDMAGKEAWIVVEKILEKEESMPPDWPVEGTTGYDFLGLVNNLLTNPEKGPLLYAYYKEWMDEPADYPEVFLKKNRFILYNRLRGELDNLTRECLSIPAVSRIATNTEALRNAIGEFLIFCPVYKIYKAPSLFTGREKAQVAGIFEKALHHNSGDEFYLNVLQKVFLSGAEMDEQEKERVDQFFRHCMQFTGPLMAKGIEDTAFYSYNPFIAHNEVGDSPGYFGIGIAAFHREMEKRRHQQPLTMNVLSTHDTKRGEDARARLNVLSDIPGKWIEATREWRRINRMYKHSGTLKEVPTPNDEYFIYQTLCAHVPMNGSIDEFFQKRLNEYLVKAMREAKENSSWRDPDDWYEKATLKFVQDILSSSSGFRAQFLQFMEEVMPHGVINSLTQLVLRNTVPGVPDTFQGTEKWNFSFVDPDNRRPVDYDDLSSSLRQIIRSYENHPGQLVRDLWKQPVNGNIKLFFHWITLKERMEHEILFLEGKYIPLAIRGKYHEHVIAFLRHFDEKYLMVVLPLNTANLPLERLWEDTWIVMPGFVPKNWENRITQNRFSFGDKLKVDAVFDVIPFGILRNV